MFCMSQGARKVLLLLLIAAGVVCINIERRLNLDFPHEKIVGNLNFSPPKPYPFINVKVRIVGYSEFVVQRATGSQMYVNSIDEVAYYTKNFITVFTPPPGVQNGDFDRFHFVIGCSKDLQTLTQHYEFNVNQSIPFGINEECRIYYRTDATDNVDVISIVMGTPSTVYLELGRGDSNIHLKISQDFCGNPPELPLPYKELLRAATLDSPFSVYSVSKSRSEELLNPIVVTSEFSQPGMLPPYVTVKVQYGEENLWLSSTIKCGLDGSLETLAENEWMLPHQRSGLDCYVISQIPSERKTMVVYLGSSVADVEFVFRPDVNDELIHLSINFYYDKEEYSRWVERGDDLIDLAADDDRQPGADTKTREEGDDSGSETESAEEDNKSDKEDKVVLPATTPSVANENLNKPIKLQTMETTEQQEQLEQHKEVPVQHRRDTTQSVQCDENGNLHGDTDEDQCGSENESRNNEDKNGQEDNKSGKEEEIFAPATAPSTAEVSLQPNEQQHDLNQQRHETVAKSEHSQQQRADQSQLSQKPQPPKHHEQSQEQSHSKKSKKTTVGKTISDKPVANTIQPVPPLANEEPTKKASVTDSKVTAPNTVTTVETNNAIPKSTAVLSWYFLLILSITLVMGV